ncbi:unnamed protein product [Aphanomyces euteiches]
MPLVPHGLGIDEEPSARIALRGLKVGKEESVLENTVQWLKVQKNRVADIATACRDITLFVRANRDKCAVIMSKFAESKRVACAAKAYQLLKQVFGQETVRRIVSREAHFNSCGACRDAANAMVQGCRAGSLNLGQERLVIAVGDSHASQVKPRFLKLYNDHVAAKKASPFPSILFKSFNGVPFLSCSPTYEPILAMIKRVRPKVVLHSMNWPQFLRPGGKDSDEIVGGPQCCRSSYRDNCDYQRPKDIPALIKQLQADLTELTSLGIKVFVATLNPEGKQFEPNHMLSGDDVGDIRPVYKSKFRQEHKELIDLVETAVAAANATLIDYADNYCWEDVCQVVDHYGRPIFKDSDHLTSTFVYRYLSVVDQVIDAAMAD